MTVFAAVCLFLGFGFVALAGMPWRDALRCVAVLAIAIAVIWMFSSVEPVPLQVGGER